LHLLLLQMASNETECNDDTLSSQWSDMSDSVFDQIDKEHLKATQCPETIHAPSNEPTGVKISESMDTDEEENLPLATLRKRLQNKVHTSDDDDADADAADDDRDQTYEPTQKDINSSDSEEDPSFLKNNISTSEDQDDHLPQIPKPKKRRRGKTRQHADVKRKKQKSLHNTNRPVKDILTKKTARSHGNNKNPKKRTANALQHALARSATTAKIHRMIESYHKKRLDNLLTSNNLKRYSVSADGNCFMHAVLPQLDDASTTVQSLRSDIANHLRDNYEHYKAFRLSTQQEDDQRKYGEEVEKLKEDSTWNTDLADCVPLALANIYKTPVRIYSSRVENPVYDIQPDLNEDTTEKFIKIACVAMRGQEHYDAVQHIDVRPVTNSAADEHETAAMHERTPTKKVPGQATTVTPHKVASYKSPLRRNIFRKRKCNAQQWKRNKRKELRNNGKSYTSSRGKKVEAKTLGKVNCITCRFKCSSKISEEERQELFTTYWQLGDYDKQRSFICQNVTQGNKKSTKRKTFSNVFQFTVNEIKHRVCKYFFLKTLSIGKKTIDYAIQKKYLGTFVGQDRRGSKASANKIPQPVVKQIHDHIKSFPTMESHYSRLTSKKSYLGAGLNIKIMFKLFKEKHYPSEKCPISESFYRKAFCENFNMSFHKPKKDQCSVCNRYDQRKRDGTLNEDMELEYSRHQQMKMWAREEKQKDKDRARNDKSVHVSTFDLEAVLPTPCSLVGELYYKRKISCYNLSYYSLADQKGTCYIWDETQGGRGANEIGSCVLKHISSVSEQTINLKEITYYSDTCGGQNRNQFMASGLLYAIKKSEHLQEINQKFFESGHSHMESDSIHSAVEHAKKNTPINVPSHWATVIAMARRNKPYVVIPLKFNDFYDLKALKTKMYGNMKVDVQGKRVNWMNIKWLQVRKETPDTLFVNYTFDPAQFLEIRVTRRRSSHGHYQLKACYTEKRPVSVAKKNDLLSLCRSGIIPEDCHAYYNALVTDKTKKDLLPSDEEDEEETTDM